MHGSHALIEAVAAIVLTLGGAAILARAWLAARRRPRRPGVRFGGDSTHIRRRSLDVLVAVLSGAAAAIHLAVGPEHVEALGDLGLGFYWAALLQAGFAVACLVAGRTPRLAVIGIALNAVLIAAWGLSRTVGVGLPDGPERIGVADGVTVVLEIALIAVLASASFARRRSVAFSVHVPAASAAIAIGGVAVLATAIALVDVGGGHDHGKGKGHELTATHAAERVTP
jgi:hypothetical protein